MVRLLILWLLAEQPLHGYRIKKILEDDGMKFWYPVEFASIYSALRTLAKDGHVIEEPSEQEGNRPPRSRYRITKGGRDLYEELLIAAWSDAPRHRHPVDVAAAAGGDLGREKILAALSERQIGLANIQAEIVRAQKAAPSALIVERARLLSTAEHRWTVFATETLQATRSNTNTRKQSNNDKP
jgi:DNA-binding PadR family transcriptional regulator